MSRLEKAREDSRKRWGSLMDDMAENAECHELIRVLNEYGYHLKAAAKALEVTSAQLVQLIEKHKLKPRWERAKGKEAQ